MRRLVLACVIWWTLVPAFVVAETVFSFEGIVTSSDFSVVSVGDSITGTLRYAPEGPLDPVAVGCYAGLIASVRIEIESKGAIESGYGETDLGPSDGCQVSYYGFGPSTDIPFEEFPGPWPQFPDGYTVDYLIGHPIETGSAIPSAHALLEALIGSSWTIFVYSPSLPGDLEWHLWMRVDSARIVSGVIPVPVDIRPQSCPNPLNCKSKGVLPAAILGTAEFDVGQIDPATVRLAGVAPLQWDYEDVATPYEPYSGKQDCGVDCASMGPDGYMDATLKFDTQEVVTALGEAAQDGACIVAQLTGNLRESEGGTEIVGEDLIRINCKGK